MYNFKHLPKNIYPVARNPNKYVPSLRLRNLGSHFVEKVVNFTLVSFLDKLLRSVAIVFIKCYQHYISPIKGYSCAHRIVYGGPSCSEYVKNTLTNTNLFESTLLTRQRFRDCKTAYISYKSRVIGPGEAGDCAEVAGPICCSIGSLIGCEAVRKR